MQVKPDVLLHWTGKDICRNLDNFNDDAARNYEERLLSIIKEGFRLTENDENIVGSGYNEFTTKPDVACFTDIGMKNAAPHTSKYGLLGIGVAREFVIQRDGRPVWYFVNREDDIHAESVSILNNYLTKRARQDHDREAAEILDRMSMLFDFAKPIEDSNSARFEYLNESEWRIVYNMKAEENGLIHKTGRNYPEYVIPFGPDDIKLIVLPNQEMRS